MSKGIDFGLFIGLPKTLISDNGVRMQSLFSIQGRDKQDALIAKRLAGFEKACTITFAKQLTGRFSSKNKHRFKQALPYLAWSFSRSAEELINSYLIERDIEDTNPLGLPHLIILDHLGYLDLDNKTWTAKQHLSVMDGVTAYSKLLPRQHFVGWPGINKVLGMYAVWWPYLLVAMVKLSDMAAEWNTSTEDERQRMIELYWAIVLLCQIKEKWAYGPHMAQAFITDNRNNTMSDLIEDSFGLPEKDFSSMAFSKSDIKTRIVPDFTLSQNSINFIVAGKKFSSVNYTQFWSSMLQELTSFYRMQTGETIDNLSSEPDLSADLHIHPANADVFQVSLELHEYTQPGANADELSWQRNLMVDHVACKLHAALDGALERATAISTWRNVLDCATLKMRLMQQGQEEDPNRSGIGQHAIITEPRLLDGDIEAFSYEKWLAGYKSLCASLNKIAALQKNGRSLLSFNEQHNLSEQICTLWREIGESLFNPQKEQESADAIKSLTDSLEQIIAMPDSAALAELHKAAQHMVEQLKNSPFHNETATGLIDLNRLYQQAIDSEASEEHSREHNISEQWAQIDATTEDLIASVSAYYDQPAIDRDQGKEQDDELQPLATDAEVRQRNADQAARIKALQATISERNSDLKKCRDVNKRLQRQLQMRDQAAGMEAPRPAEAIINSNSPLVKGLLATIDSDDPVAVLRLAERFCQGALVITPNAFETAKQYRRSEYSPEALLAVLLKLAVDYLPLYREGGDTLARNVFGASYRACESDVVINSGRLRQQRMFDVGGKKKLVTAHIAINLFLRVYFYIDQESNNVAVTYCGRHLECASTN